jgi:glycosyltransferase involved in cell wall biosynthesis
MTVWIVNPFDNLPSEGYRPQRYWLMARAFAQAGHRTTYWTSDFSHAHKAPRKLDGIDGMAGACGFRMKFVPTKPYPTNICLRRILSHRAFARTWRKLAEAESERPDVVIASLPPLSSCAAALEFCRRAGARFIVDVQDAWPETFYRVAPAWMFAPFRATARRIYRSADAVTAVATRYIELARSYGATAPSHLCHLGISLREVNGERRKVKGEVKGERRKVKDGSIPTSPFTFHHSPFTPETPFTFHHSPFTPETPFTFHHSPFTLLYLGAMGASYDLETVIDAVKEMEDVELDIAGSGPKESALRARAEDCSRIRFHGYLAENDLQMLLSKADVGVIPMFPDSCVGVPNKLADYAAAGLRVINSLPGETADIVARFSAGTFYDTGSVESFKAAVRDLQKKEASGFLPDAFRDFFDARRLYSDYVRFVQTL